MSNNGTSWATGRRRGATFAPPTPLDDSRSSRPPPTASWLPLARCRPQSVSSACSLLFFHTVLCCVLCYHTVLRAPGYWRLVYILALFVSTVNNILFTCIWFLPKINWCLNVAPPVVLCSFWFRPNSRRDRIFLVILLKITILMRWR